MNARRTPILALSAIVGALAICMAVPALDPRCAMGSDHAGTIGACTAVEAGSRDVALLILAIATIVGAMLVASVGVHAVMHHRVSRRLGEQARPAVIANQFVGLVPGSGAALVAGIRRPRIYCAEDLITCLDAEELRAVLLHERHHQLAHAPSRLVLLAALAAMVGHLGPAAAWLERQRAGIEIAADRHALSHGATRVSVARAILKLQETAPSVALAGFATAGELRLRSLLGEDSPSSTAHLPGPWQTLAVGTIVAITCSALSLI